MKNKMTLVLIICTSICILFNLFIAFGFKFPTHKINYYNDFSFFNSFHFRKSSWASGPSPDPIWTPENVQYNNGKMILKINKNENSLTTGEVFTYNTFGYGLYQVRMIPIKNPGVVSSFFNYAEDGDVGTEIDIEFLGYDTTKVQFNYHTNGVGGHEYLYDLGFDASDDFHTYGFNWTKDAIYWYVDGILAYEVHADNIPKLEAPIAMDVWAGGKEEWLHEYDGKAPLSAYYDWISFTSP